MSELLTSFRHELHAHPELAHAEHATADRVVAFMQQFNPTEIVTGIAGTGVVVTFDSGVEGPRMLFRCELDALPIVETGVFGYASVDAGVSHKCGHDGHMAMIAGLGEALAARPLERGVVHLLFQPAEETGTGAAAVLNDPALLLCGVLSFGLPVALLMQASPKKGRTRHLRWLICCAMPTPLS